MENYDTLKSVMAEVEPSGVEMDSYSPTNSPQACPPVSKDWAVKGNTLPPTPDSSLCDCMFSSVSCAPADDLDVKDYKPIFDYVCEQEPKACAGINGNTTSGVYGAYSMCNPKEKLAYVLDQYYQSQGKATTACDFEGQATIKKATEASNCKSALSSASSANEIAATATSGPDSTSDSSSESSSNAAVAFGPARGLFALGDLAVGLYVIVAMGVGAGMVLL